MEKYHITKKGEDWCLIKENADRASKTFETKQDALEYSKEHVKSNGGSLIIYKENGQIQEERTYPKSADPSKSKG